jgi:gamma-glutamylcyclotransferase (GGCT)/AIG2-like uncharacterized protein YtfP
MVLFVYGTLLDDDVFALVTGRSAPFHDRRQAMINGYRRVCRAGASYPILVNAPEAQVDGAVVGGITPREIERLKTFEGEEYDLVPLTVYGRNRRRVNAHGFMAKAWVPASTEEWTLAAWRRRHKRRYLARLRAFRTWSAD